MTDFSSTGATRQPERKAFGRAKLQEPTLEAKNLTISARPFRHFAASGAVVVGLTALIAVWNWSTEPPVVVRGQLSAPESASRALFHSDGRERVMSEFFNRVSPGKHDPGESLISDYVARWWPEHVGNAALEFLCAPKISQDTHHSVMVWTDAKNNVVAYGAALQGGALAPYATGLVDANEPDLGQLVYPAAQGFRVVATGTSYALKIRDTNLGCVPSKGD